MEQGSRGVRIFRALSSSESSLPIFPPHYHTLILVEARRVYAGGARWQPGPLQPCSHADTKGARTSDLCRRALRTSLSFTLAVVAPEARLIKLGMLFTYSLCCNPFVPTQFGLSHFLGSFLVWFTSWRSLSIPSKESSAYPVCSLLSRRGHRHRVRGCWQC